MIVTSILSLMLLLIMLQVISTRIHSEVAIVGWLSGATWSSIVAATADSSKHAICVESGMTSERQSHQMLVFARLRTPMDTAVLVALSSLPSANGSTSHGRAESSKACGTNSSEP